jgi:DNA-binding phage protein
MLTLEEIREKLSDRVVSKVAERTGIHRETLYRIIRGGGANFSTVEKLSIYFEAN